MKKITIGLVVGLMTLTSAFAGDLCDYSLENQAKQQYKRIERWFSMLNEGQLTNEEVQSLVKGSVDLMQLEALRVSALIKSGLCR